MLRLMLAPIHNPTIQSRKEGGGKVIRVQIVKRSGYNSTKFKNAVLITKVRKSYDPYYGDPQKGAPYFGIGPVLITKVRKSYDPYYGDDQKGAPYFRIGQY